MGMPMSENLSVKVRVIGPNGNQADGTVQIQTWDKKERTRRALKTLGMCWAGAILAIPFPIVHLILVPGLFLAGIVAVYFILGQTSVVLGGEGKCPKCGESLPIVRAADKWPMSELCAKCQTALTIERA